MGLCGFGARCCCCSTNHWIWNWPPEKEKTLWRAEQLSSYTYVCTSHYGVFGCTYYASPSILNDSSLASIILINNYRHLFFQGPQSVIRRMIYSENKNQWFTDPGSIAISDAKHLNPLAVSHYYGSQDYGDTEEAPEVML